LLLLLLLLLLAVASPRQVLHSDLKVRNVLLKSDASARGCIAKVADFGLAVRMDCNDTHVSAFQVMTLNKLILGKLRLRLSHVFGCQRQLTVEKLCA
jgi:serine/threonine protein kinase